MGKEIEILKKRFDKKVEEKIKSEKYKQWYLKDLDITEPIGEIPDAFFMGIRNQEPCSSAAGFLIIFRLI